MIPRNATVWSVIGAILYFFAATAHGVDIRLIAPANVVAGELLEVTIAGDFSEDPTLGGGLELTWNPSILNLESWNVVAPGGAADGDGSSGSIELGFGDFAGYSGSGMIATLTFTTTVIGTSAVTIDTGQSFGPLIDAATLLPQQVTYIGAIVEVVGLNPCQSIDCDNRLTRQDAEIHWRYIGILPEINGVFGACPIATGWTRSKLFQFEGTPMPRAMQQYCLYVETSPGSGNPQTLFQLRDQNELVQVDPDIMAVTFADGPLGEYTDTPQARRSGGGQSLKQIVDTSLQTYFREQAGAVDPLPTGEHKIRLAVLDSYPDSKNPLSETSHGTAPHGHALIHMADDLVCGDPRDSGCSLDVTTNLALPWMNATGPSSANLSEGGTIGSPGDVARAIRRALVSFAQDEDEVERLVINMSVGWNNMFDLNDAGANHAAVLAVRTAFEIAACRGAILITSSGNPEGGRDGEDGPLTPATYETLPAPDFQRCNNELLPPTALANAADFPSAGETVPLVYAVGAVRSDGRPVHRRARSEPERVAFGDHAMATAAIGEPTGTITGTSGGAIVVSAAAALAWSHLPTMAGWEIMKIVENTGVAVVPARLAAYCPSGSCAPVKRIDLCHVARAACNIDPMCTAMFSCPTRVPYRNPILPVSDIETAFTDVTVVNLTDADWVQNAVGECGQAGGMYRLYHRNSIVPTYPCPHVQYYGSQATPWTDPQPGNNNCEDCPITYNSPGTLYIEIDELLDTTAGTADAESATLYCVESPTLVTAWSLAELGPLTDEDRIIVTGIPMNCAEKGLFLSMKLINNPPCHDRPSKCASLVAPILTTTDPDLDGIPASIDNCSRVANPDQRDTNGDGIGNICDTDIDDNCIVDFFDLNVYRANFLQAGDLDTDNNGDGQTNFADLNILKTYFFGPPGPGDSTSCNPF